MALSLITEQKKRDSILGSLLAPEGIAPEVMAGPLPSFTAARPTLEPVLNQRIVGQSADPLTNLKDSTEADLFKRMNPVAPTTALGKIGHTVANAANVLGEIFAPAATANIKGSRLNNQERIGDDKDTLDEVSALESQRDTRAQTEANTRYLNARPDIEQSKIDQKQTAVQQRVGQAAAARGQKVSWGPDGLPTFEDDHDSQAFADHQALSSLHDANAERSKILADIAKNHYIPGTPEFNEAQRKLKDVEDKTRVAMGNLAQRARGESFQEDKFYNPQPTGTERKTGDLASSAVNQIKVMKDIINRRQEHFGPGAGSGTQFQTWLGSEDPDAAAYNAAQNYLAEHSASVFGGRSAYVLKELKGLTNQRQNVGALNSTLDRAQSTAEHFVDAGTTHGKGSQGFAAKQGAPDTSAPKRPANIPEGYHYDANGPKGKGWYR